jgi:hypothetical protein
MLSRQLYFFMKILFVSLIICSSLPVSIVKASDKAHILEQVPSSIGNYRPNSIVSNGQLVSAYWNFNIINGTAPYTGNGSDLRTVTRFANGPCANKQQGQCVFDTREVVTISPGVTIDSITAYGKYWNYDANGTLTSGLLSSIYGSGPCSNQDQLTCKFDSRAFTVINNELIDSITVGNKAWNIRVSNGTLFGNVVNLKQVPRYGSNNGPCASLDEYTCHFDARSIYTDTNGQQIEIIIRDGKIWRFNTTDPNHIVQVHPSNEALTSTSLSHYATGPCTGLTGTNCNFDTYTVITDGSNRIESITERNETAATCKQQSFYLSGNPANGTFTLHNCSNASIGAINNILSNSDAARMSLLKSNAIYMANKRWVIWIDKNTSPGILRGLWPIDSDGAASSAMLGDPFYSNAFKSIVQPYAGYSSTNPTYGYKGLHTEIWRPDGTSMPPYYTYPTNTTPEVSNISYNTASVSANFRITLKNVKNGSSTYIDPVNGTQSRLRWYISYNLTPNEFEIKTSLGSIATNSENSVPVNILGDAGGLLLLINRACHPTTSCSSAQFARDNSFSIAETWGGSADQINGCVTDISPGPTGNRIYDFLSSTCQNFNPSEDRYIVRTGQPPSVFNFISLRQGNRPISLQFGATFTAGKSSSWMGFTAYHYNPPEIYPGSSTSWNGFGSLDAVLRSGSSALIVDDTNEGRLNWTVTLYH